VKHSGTIHCSAMHVNRGWGLGLGA
jgi:hypothetical protein